LIVLNTLVLSFDKYPENIGQTMILEKVNMVFIYIFTVELVIKFLALGFKNYFTHYSMGPFNTFDCIIVIASLIDLFLSNFLVINSALGDGGSVITALRGIRLLRIFKLAKHWKRFELLLETIWRTFYEITSFTILMFLFIFIFTLLGLELFANKAKFNVETGNVDFENGESPIFNFDNFLNSFTTVFIVLSNDSLQDIYLYYYRACGPASSSIFFILITIVGQKILLNIFLAILLEHFDEGALKQRMHDIEMETVKGKEVLFVKQV
jgi:hypothetical protein